MDVSRSGLISHNKIQYSATYFLNRTDLTNDSQYICMVRNQNGLNYKMLIVSPSDLAGQAVQQFVLNNYHPTFFWIALAIIVLVILIALLLIYVLVRKSKRRRRTNRTSGSGASDQVTNNLKNLNSMSHNLGKTQKACLIAVAQNKLSNKSVKDPSYLINSDRRTSNPNGNFYTRPPNPPTYQSPIKYNQPSSKFSSANNSMQRLNNTPVPGDTFNQLDV